MTIGANLKLRLRRRIFIITLGLLIAQVGMLGHASSIQSIWRKTGPTYFVFYAMPPISSGRVCRPAAR